MLKPVQRGSREITIARSLSSPDNLSNVDNHCVPILDYFDDMADERKGILIMPLLRRFNNPNFIFISEVVEFVRQTIRVSSHVTGR